MRLYNFDHSPNPLKIRLAFAELGLEYETEEIVLFAGAHRREDFTKINPHQKVPVLDDGSFRLRESNAILAYLGQKTGRLWPAAPEAAAAALQWLFFESAHLSESVGTFWWNDTVAPAIEPPARTLDTEASLAEARKSLARSFNLLEQHLAERRFILGDDFSLVDCSVGVAVSMLHGTSAEDPRKWPRVFDYAAQIRARRSWAAARGDGIYRFE